MKTISKILAIAACSLAFAACSDEVTGEGLNQDNLKALESPALTFEQATAYTLSFSWEKVANATQYGYQLLDEYGAHVDGGMTNSNTALITGLDHSTSYTFEVWALPKAYSPEFKASAASALVESTLEVKPLAAPAGLAVKISGLKAILSWEEVPNAEYYVYNYTDGKGSEVYGYTYDTTLSIIVYNKNTEYKFNIYAESDDELWSSSPTVSITFQR